MLPDGGPAGVRATARHKRKPTQHGKPQRWFARTNRTPARARSGPCGVADRLVVPLKPSNAGGGKGPDFGSGLEVGRLGRVTMLSITSHQRLEPAEGSS